MPRIVEIKDISQPELDAYARLTEAQLRNRLEPEKGIFIAESPKVISLALDGGYQPLSILTERKHIEGQAREIISRCPDIPVYTADDSVLEKLTGYRLTRGVLCAMRRPAPKAPQEICSGDNVRRIAVLENIADATNVGAIVRSAAALGVDAVLVTPSCCDPLCRRAVRVSMGTIFQIPWAYVCDEPQEWTAWLQKRRHGSLQRFGRNRRPPADGGEKARHSPWLRGGRTEQGDYRRLRLHGEDTHVPRRGLTECGGCERGCILAASSEIALPQYKL